MAAKTNRRIDRGPLANDLALQIALTDLERMAAGEPSANSRAEMKRAQSALSTHLLAYAKGEIPEVHPHVAYAIGDALRDLDRGTVCPLLQSHHDRGSPQRSYAADNALGYAALYIKLARSKVINDRKATARVSEWFGIDDNSTVRRWVREISTDAIELAWMGGDFRDPRTVSNFQTIVQNVGASYPSLSGTRTARANRDRAAKVGR